MPRKKSLFTALGGADAVNAAVDLFYEKVLGDPELAPFFTDTDMAAQKVHQKAFLMKALGGKSNYQGRGPGARDLTTTGHGHRPFFEDRPPFPGSA